MSKLGSQELAEFVAVPATAGYGATDEARWIVFFDDEGIPIGAIPPGSVLTPRDPVPAIIVAHADVELDDALTSPAFEEVDTVIAVVVHDGDQVIGVWGGDSLARAVAEGPTYPVGTTLPGVPRIPVIVRSCVFTEAGTVCGTVETFQSKPIQMPECKNAQNLSLHDFDW